jgi:hypothetical protein
MVAPNGVGRAFAMLADQFPGQALQLIREELRQRRAHIVRHRTQSLEQHLVNTFEMLAAWQQPARVQYAGLLHDGYSTDVLGDPMFEMSERHHVRSLIGETAERLAFLYCATEGRALVSVVRAPANQTSDVFTLTSRLDGHPVQLTRVDAADLLTIQMASVAEQCCQPDRSPGSWLSYVSTLGHDVRRLVERTPPVFDDCTAVVNQTDEARLIAAYEQLVAGAGCVGGSAKQVGATLIDLPFVAEPLVWMGFDALARGAPQDAPAYGREAAVRLRQWGIPWDKRLRLRQWLQLCATLCDTTIADELAFVAKRIIAKRIIAAGDESRWPECMYMVLARMGLLPRVGGGNNETFAVADDSWSATPADAPTAPALPTRFRKYIAGLRSDPPPPRVGMYPGLESTPWHDPQQFRLARDLEAAADEIAAEARALTGAGFLDEPDAALVPSGRWSYLPLYVGGHKKVNNCARCPQIVAVIDANRDLLSLGGIVTLSVLEPDTHVVPHEGPTNMILRCHLGIDVPEGCGLRVGGITRTWEQGRCLVFDDTFTHEVWNHGTQRRVVLMVDMWRPDLTDDEVALLNALQLPEIYTPADFEP